MKTRTKTLLAALMLLAISCKKENSTFQSASITDESSTQALPTETNETGELTAGKIRIGTQVWMTKNLAVGHYRNGDKIPRVKNKASWDTLTTGAWCWYNNDSANDAVYGKLYNWLAVNDPRGLAPAGWHVPSDSEWTTLTSFLGGPEVAGGKMKSTGTIEAGTGLWNAPNDYATNSSGFTGLPGGIRMNYGYFTGLGGGGTWWSSTAYNKNITKAWYGGSLGTYSETFVRSYNSMRYGYSVRCVKD